MKLNNLLKKIYNYFFYKPIQEEITYNKKPKINIPFLIETLGSINNISSFTSKINSVSITVKNPSLIKKDQLKKTKIKGIIIISNKINLITNKDTKLLKDTFNKLLNV